MADAARAVCRVSDAPVIVDADTGYGNAVNVLRTVARPPGRRRRRGLPRGPGLAEEVRPLRRASRSCRPAEHAAKIRAAADARGDRDLFIVARTDARQPLGARGGDRALPRLQGGGRRRAVRRGAAVGRRSSEQIADGAARAARREHDRARRHAAPVARPSCSDLGFQLIVCPLAALYAATRAVTDVLTELKRQGDDRRRLRRLTTFDEFGELVELEERYADESKYAP